IPEGVRDAGREEDVEDAVDRCEQGAQRDQAKGPEMIRTGQQPVEAAREVMPQDRAHAQKSEQPDREEDRPAAPGRSCIVNSAVPYSHPPSSFSRSSISRRSSASSEGSRCARASTKEVATARGSKESIPST